MSPFLRRVLLADAALCAATGLSMTLGTGSLVELLGVPAPLIMYSGISLLPFAAFVAYLATREQLNRPGVWAVIACNALWALDSVLILLAGWLEPTAVGGVFVVAQALIVAGFAEAEYFGLRRSAAAA
jgi:hypothetical protein